MKEEIFNIRKDIYFNQILFSKIVGVLGILIMIMGVGFTSIHFYVGLFIILTGFLIIIEALYFCFEDKRKYADVIFEIKRRLQK